MKSPAIEFHELHIPGSGIREVTVEELAARCATDPSLREAIDVMERAAGAPSEIKLIINKQLVHDMRSEMRAESQRRAIEFGMRKQKTIADYESKVAR